jgi:DNA-binding CsgD family transcriptional regulator
MTSNVAIGNTAAASMAPASNAAPSDHFARLLNPTAVNGGQLIAGGLRRTNSAKIVEGWREAVESKTGQATESGKPLVITAPRSGRHTNVSATLNTAIGGKTLKVPGVPEFSGSVSGLPLAALDKALTPQRLEAFRGLDEDGKAVVRTLLSAALEAMDLPVGDPGHISRSYMGHVVDAALTYAKQTQTAPGRPATKTPTTQRVEAAPASVGTAATPQVQPQQRASATAASLSTQEKTLLREINRGSRATDIAREQKWSAQQYDELCKSAISKLGARTVQGAARRAAGAGGLLSAYTRERFELLSNNETVKLARLTPDAIKTLSVLTQSYFDRDATASQLGLTADSLMSSLSASARSLGLVHGTKKMGMNDLRRFLLVATTGPGPQGSLPFTPTAPKDCPDAVRQRLDKLSANKQVQQDNLTTRDLQVLSYWTHFNFNRNMAADQLEIAPESLSVFVSASSKKLGFATGRDGQDAFKRFLLEATK